MPGWGGGGGGGGVAPTRSRTGSCRLCAHGGTRCGQAGWRLQGWQGWGGAHALAHRLPARSPRTWAQGVGVQGKRQPQGWGGSTAAKATGKGFNNLEPLMIPSAPSPLLLPPSSSPTPLHCDCPPRPRTCTTKSIICITARRAHLAGDSIHSGLTTGGRCGSTNCSSSSRTCGGPGGRAGGRTSWWMGGRAGGQATN